MSTDTQYTVEQIHKYLVGGRITGAVQTPDTDDPFADFAGLIVTLPNGTVRHAWVQRDAEGNGAGWLDIETPEEEAQS